MNNVKQFWITRCCSI